MVPGSSAARSGVVNASRTWNRSTKQLLLTIMRQHLEHGRSTGLHAERWYLQSTSVFQVTLGLPWFLPPTAIEHLMCQPLTGTAWIIPLSVAQHHRSYHATTSFPLRRQLSVTTITLSCHRDHVTPHRTKVLAWLTVCGEVQMICIWSS